MPHSLNNEAENYLSFTSLPSNLMDHLQTGQTNNAASMKGQFLQDEILCTTSRDEDRWEQVITGNREGIKYG